MASRTEVDPLLRREGTSRNGWQQVADCQNPVRRGIRVLTPFRPEELLAVLRRLLVAHSFFGLRVEEQELVARDRELQLLTHAHACEAPSLVAYDRLCCVLQRRSTKE